MRWVSFLSGADGRERAGCCATGRSSGIDSTLLELFEADGGLTSAAERAAQAPTDVVAHDGLRVAAPIPRPPSVRDFLCFEQHLRNALTGLGRDDIPTVWFDQPSKPHNPTPLGSGHRDRGADRHRRK